METDDTHGLRTKAWSADPSHSRQCALRTVVPPEMAQRGSASPLNRNVKTERALRDVVTFGARRGGWMA